MTLAFSFSINDNLGAYFKSSNTSEERYLSSLTPSSEGKPDPVNRCSVKRLSGVSGRLSDEAQVAEYSTRVHHRCVFGPRNYGSHGERGHPAKTYTRVTNVQLEISARMQTPTITT